MKRKNLIIIGMGEQGNIVEQIVKNNQLFRFIGYIDDNRYIECLGNVDSLIKFKNSEPNLRVFIAIGRNRVREKIFLKVQEMDIEFANIIHPTATIENTTTLGKNVFIGPKAIINNNSILGNGVYVNSGCIVEHDNIIGNFAQLAPGVITGGGVLIGAKSFLGIGVRVNDHLSIGDEALIASGSIVAKSVGINCSVGGIPAKHLILDKKTVARYI